MTPLFLSTSNKLLSDWENAFPGARLLKGLPKSIDAFENEIVLVDISSLSIDEKRNWLNVVLSSSKKVIVLNSMPNEVEALSVIKLGARGYGHAHSGSLRLREMVVVVEHGGVWVGNKVLKRILAGIDSNQPQGEKSKQDPSFPNPISGLSARESMVAKGVAMGATNAEISEKLNITERTVKAHISSIFDKIGVRNRVELALKINDLPSLSSSTSSSSSESA
ncbi:response regulator transcription factor [Ketobacter sp. MCCC 1A13808]|uniref:response regulator transcription factor n=1 Tax=Ketobacter sp. MCCC 1A13808 TaxID=2602738 RepID=UPI000F288B7D|nr:response regulator transcription factor [Ketobacter sp. MCCC 1A13808]MVF14887.1 response regulator transcription factor [Ketobacter sp. MCCC 1A13808]RLP52758.1 MAG: DNA-binding response regulator [Ketobacter sp.]